MWSRIEKGVLERDQLFHLSVFQGLTTLCPDIDGNSFLLHLAAVYVMKISATSMQFLIY